MFCSLHLPDLALEAILRFRPESRASPCAVVEQHARHPDPTAPLLAVNAPAAARQLVPGTPTTQALARCPGLILFPRQPDAERSARHAALLAALAISPTLEQSGPDTLTLSVDAIPAARHHPADWLMETLGSLVPLGLPARLSLAPHPDLAHLAALHPATSATLSFDGPEPLLQPPQQPVPTLPVHLSPLPLEFATFPAACPLPANLLPILQLWGIRTLGQLAQLPRADLVHRVGPAITPLLQLLHHPSPRPLRLFQAPISCSHSLDLELPIENHETLVFLLKRLIDSLVSRMDEGRRVASEVELELRLENGDAWSRRFRLPEPTREVAHLLRPLQTHLEHLQLPGAVQGLTVGITPALPDASERGLFDQALRHPHRFIDTLARLESMLGPDSVGIPVAADSHRPDDFQVRPYPAGEGTPLPKGPTSDTRRASLPLRRYRPPIPIAVAGDSAAVPRPLALLTGPCRGNVTGVRGPFPMSGHWWDPASSWQRVEWDLELATGHLLRVAFLPPSGWQLEGSYE